MKTSMKLILVLLFTAFSLQTFAQKPEPVYSITRQIHDFDWYEQQAKAWKKEIDRGTKDKMAWVYWFMANRNAGRFCDYKKWESKIGDYFISKGKLIEMAEKAIPNTFEYYYLKLYEKDFPGSNSTKDYLFRAQELKPYDNMLLPGLVNLHIFNNDYSNLEITCKKWFESNEMPQELMITAYNNLISLDQNAILITSGDNDTYPCWVLQYGLKIRQDITVLNINNLTYNNSYRENKFKELGIPQIAFTNDSDKLEKNVFRHIIKNIISKPVYTSIFMIKDIYKEFENEMYFVGLSLKYSKKPFNNIAVLRNNIENKFMLDFLKRSFYNNPAESACKRGNGGYVASFVKLADYYKQSGELDKAKKMKELAITVAKNSGYTEWLKEIEK